MRSRGCFFFIFFFLSGFAYTDSAYHIADISFYPDPIYIGDEVSCRLVIQKQPGVICESPEEALPDVGSFRFRSITVQDEGERAYIDIVFAPYAVGVFYLPPILCGDVELSGIKVTVISLAKQGETLSMSSPASVYRLRGVYITAAMAGCLIMPIPILLFVFLPGFGYRLRKTLLRIFRRNPYKIFLINSRNLMKSSEFMDSRQLYNEMTGIFRGYLTQRTGENFFIVMTRDMREKLSVYLDNEEACDRIAEIMIHSDAVRFGSGTEDVSRERKDLLRVQETVRQIEEHLTGRHVPK